MAKRSRGRRIARGAGYVVAGLALLVVLAIAALQTPWGRSWLRQRVEAKLAAAFTGGATLGALDYSPLFAHVELHDVAIRDRAGRVAIRAGTIAADLDRTSLVRGTPVLDALTVTGLSITAIDDATGGNLVGLAAPSRGPLLTSVAIHAFSITGAATLTRLDGTAVTVSELGLGGALAARPADHQLDLTLGPLAAKLAIAMPGQPVRALELAIAATTVARGPNATELRTTALVLGPLSIGAAHGKLEAGAPALALTALRVDHAQLRALLGKDVLVDDVTGEVTIAGPPSALVVHARLASRATDATLDGTLDVSDRARPRYQLALVGQGASTDLTRAPMPRIATRLRVALTGAGVRPSDIDATLDAELGATTIGATTIDGVSARVQARDGGLTLAQLSARGLGATLGATGTMSADRTIDARATLAGDPDQAIAQLRAAGLASAALPHLPHAALAITAHGMLDGTLALVLEPATIAIAGGTIATAGHARLEHRVLASAAASIALRHLDLAALSRLAGRPPVAGSLDGTLALSRTTSDRADYDLTVALPALAGLAVRARGHASPSDVTTNATILRDGVALATVTAELPIDRRGLVPDRAWHVALAMPRRALAELAALAPAELRVQLETPGMLELQADLRGTPAAPRGTLDATLTGARHAELHATIAPGGGVAASGSPSIVVTTNGTLGLDALDRTAPPFGGAAGQAHTPAIDATIAGSLAVSSPFAGRAFVRPTVTLDHTLTLPDRAIADLPAPAQLAALGGTVGGTIHVTGAPATLRLDGALGWRGFRTADGGTGTLALALAGTPTQLTATITDGAATIVADITRTPERLDVRARAHADDSPLLPLLPALVPAIPHSEAGRLRLDMRADLGLARSATGFALDRAALDGTLDVTGASFDLPHSTRRWHDIALSLAGDPAGLRLTRLELHETDHEVADRAVRLSGLLALDRLRPTKLDLALDIHDWLLLGLTSPLFTDAPTATLDLRAQIAGDLTAAIPALDVTVATLALRSPDRHDRAHQPERASVSGDIIFVDASTPAGKLPVPPPHVPPHGLPALDVRVHVPNPTRLNRGPLDVVATGELAVTVRPDEVTPSGALTMQSGTLNAFAADHTLVRGRVVFSRAHPIGWLDLVFARRLPDPEARALRDPQRPEYVTLGGEPTRPVPALSGSANSTLPEVEAMYDAGRSVYAPNPGIPTSSSAQVPRGDQLNVLAYVSLVLPQLLVLDRMSAWSDASEPRGAYGRIRNLEADRYTAGERDRVRAVARPTTPGRSSAELQLDHVFLHDARRVLGIGVRAGDRLGGGVGLVLEWSSASPSAVGPRRP